MKHKKFIKCAILVAFQIMLSTWAMGQNCLDFSNYINDVNTFNNNSTFPSGSTLIQLNGVKIKKPFIYDDLSTSPIVNDYTNILGVTNSMIDWIGFLDFDLTGLNTTCKKFKFERTSFQSTSGYIIVNSDTIQVGMDAQVGTYNGSGYSAVISSDSTLSTYWHLAIEITGSYNNIRFFSSGLTWGAGNFCAESCQPTTGHGCIDFANYNLNASNFTFNPSNLNDDIVYPAGSELIQSGGLKVIKTLPSFVNPPDTNMLSTTYFINWPYNMSDTVLSYIGVLDIITNTGNLACRKLTISLTNFNTGFLINGDSIGLRQANPNSPMDTLPDSYSGNGFNMIKTGVSGVYRIFEITGNYNSIRVFGGPIGPGAYGLDIKDICLESCQPTTGPGCIDFANYNIPSFNNDTLYPAGSTLASSADLSVIKPYTSNYSAWPYGTHILNGAYNADSNTIYFIGYLDINTANYNANCKKLRFTVSNYSTILLVNGDSIDISQNNNSYYTNNGITIVKTPSGVANYDIVEVSGGFNVLRVLGWGNGAYLKDICLESCQPTTTCNADFSVAINGNDVLLTNISGSATNYWIINPGTNQNFIYTPNLTYTFPQMGEYKACLAVSDSNGQFCDSICKIIYITCNEMLNTITPNGDGIDDQTTFACFKQGKTQTIDIYNNTGRSVRTLRNTGIWDGRDNSGNIVPMGYYVAICKETKEASKISVVR